MEYYLATKENKVLTHATTQMSIEDIKHSERCQTQKTKYCMILFI